MLLEPSILRASVATTAKEVNPRWSRAAVHSSELVVPLCSDSQHHGHADLATFTRHGEISVTGDTYLASFGAETSLPKNG